MIAAFGTWSANALCIHGLEFDCGNIFFQKKLAFAKGMEYWCLVSFIGFCGRVGS